MALALSTISSGRKPRVRYSTLCRLLELTRCWISSYPCCTAWPRYSIMSYSGVLSFSASTAGTRVGPRKCGKGYAMLASNSYQDSKDIFLFYMLLGLYIYGNVMSIFDSIIVALV